MTLLTMPDWRACMYQWVTAQPEFSDDYGDRLYRTIPARKVFPLGRVSMVADPPMVAGTHSWVLCQFQFDLWGDSEHIAWTMAETVRALLTQRLTGPQSTAEADFVAGMVRAGGILPSTEPLKSQAVTAGSDAESSVARHRCRFDAAVPMRPVRSTGS